LEITAYSEAEPTTTPIPGASVVSTAAEPSSTPESEPPVSGRITTSTNSSRSIDTGALTSTPDGAWILSPRCGFRLTIEAEKDVAVQVKTLLDSRLHENLHDGEEKLAPIIARSKLRCREIEEYVRTWRPRNLTEADRGTEGRIQEGQKGVRASGLLSDPFFNWRFYWRFDIEFGRISSYSTVLVLKHHGPRNSLLHGPWPRLSMAPRARLELAT